MIYEIKSKIVGVSFKNSDGSSRQELISNIKETDKLTIEHEPDNPYDKNSHIIKCNNKILGHLSRELAKDIMKRKKEGQKLLGIQSFKVTGGTGKQSHGVNIIILMEKQQEDKND